MEQLITERLKAAFGELLVVPLIEADYTLPATIKELVEFSKGQSVVRPEQKREGLVLRTFDYKTSFKVINPEFLLEEDDK
jgi:hypothetical protein